MSTATPTAEVIITPSADQYRQLAEDLDKLRKRGARSNTAAIIEAVRMAADYDGLDNVNGRQTTSVPGPGTGGKS